jgi:uncharacterized membrane protein
MMVLDVLLILVMPRKVVFTLCKTAAIKTLVPLILVILTLEDASILLFLAMMVTLAQVKSAIQKSVVLSLLFVVAMVTLVLPILVTKQPVVFMKRFPAMMVTNVP